MRTMCRVTGVAVLLVLGATFHARAGDTVAPKTYSLRPDAFSLLGGVQLQKDPGFFSQSLIEIPASSTGIVATGNRATVEAEEWLEVTYGGKTGWLRESSLTPESGLRPLLNPEPVVDMPLLLPPPPALERRAAEPDHIDMTIGTLAGTK